MAQARCNTVRACVAATNHDHFLAFGADVIAGPSVAIQQ